jgi:hypothetical protein
VNVLVRAGIALIIVVLFAPLLSPQLRKVDLTAEERAVAVPIGAAALGAALVFVWTFALKRRDERRELRAVGRLVDVELAQAAALLDPHRAGIGKRAWDDCAVIAKPLPRHDQSELVEQAGGLHAWQVKRRRERLTATAWHEHKLLLARLMKYHEWERLRSAYTAIEDAKENTLGGEALGWTLDAIHRARGLTLHRIDRARGVLERHIADRVEDAHDWLEAAIELASEDARSGPPRVVGVNDLVRELHAAVTLRRFSAKEAESLAGYLLMRSAGMVPKLGRQTIKEREARLREFGFVLDSSGTFVPKDEDEVPAPDENKEPPSS